MKRLPRLRRVWFVTQCDGIHSKGTFHTFVDVLIHAPLHALEFILAYTPAAGTGEICTYIKDHEDPLNGPAREVWRMHEYAPALTTFDLETELRRHL